MDSDNCDIDEVTLQQAKRALEQWIGEKDGDDAEVVEDDLATPEGSESFEERQFIDKVDLSAKEKLLMAKAEADMEQACADLINGDVPAEIIELAK